MFNLLLDNWYVILGITMGGYAYGCALMVVL